MTRPATAGAWSGRTFWVSFAVFSALLLLWIVATPRFASPDENAHFLKAAAVARGQLIGPQDESKPGAPTIVTVPASLAAASLDPACFAFRAEITADCAPDDVPANDEPVQAQTQAGRYPPAYYLVAGLPTLVWLDLDVVYLVRGLSGLLCAALLAAALTVAAGTGRRLLVLAVGYAVTPMVLFLASGVNPNSIEVAAAVAFWVAGAVLAISTGPPARAVLTTAGVAGVVFLLARPISPLWVALAGLVFIVLAGRQRIVELVRARAVQVWLGVLFVVALAQAAWVVVTDAAKVFGAGIDLPLRNRIHQSWNSTDDRLEAMVGYFGWLDTPAPDVVLWVWGVLGALLLLAALWRPVPIRALLLAAVIVAGLTVPIALEVRSVPDVGFFWQGRYTLPLAVGAPVLAALTWRRARRVPLAVVLPAVLALVVAHVAAFVVTLARYTVGEGEGLGLLEQEWVPPVPVLPLVAAFVLATAAYGAWLAWLPVARQPAREPDPVLVA